MVIKLVLCGLVMTMFIGCIGLVLWEVAKLMARDIEDDDRFDD